MTLWPGLKLRVRCSTDCTIQVPSVNFFFIQITHSTLNIFVKISTFFLFHIYGNIPFHFVFCNFQLFFQQDRWDYNPVCVYVHTFVWAYLFERNMCMWTHSCTYTRSSLSNVFFGLKKVYPTFYLFLTTFISSSTLPSVIRKWMSRWVIFLKITEKYK